MADEREEWRPAPGWEDRYEVSSLGRVRSFPVLINDGKRRAHFLGQSGRILSPAKGKYGHRTVTLYDGSGSKQVGVHRLVCEAFHGPPLSDKNWALHRDGDPNNNRKSNIRWGSPAENSADAVSHGSFGGEGHSTAKFSDAQIREFRELVNSGSLSIRKAAKRVGLSERYAFKVLAKEARRCA